MNTEIEEASIATLHRAFRDGAMTSRRLVEFYLDRIDRIDRSGPHLNAIAAVNDRALDDASALDATYRATGQFVGSLHGIPVVLKDSIATAGLVTAYGSMAFAGYRPPADAAVVELLRRAGAVILAKTTLPDFATSWFGHSSATGETLNPYDPARDPGGSSSGTGAAVSANLAAVGIGGDTGGSIRVPASFTGLVGVRPTTGLVSRRGVAPLVSFEDTCGPMTRTVADAARLLDVLIAYDAEDAFTAQADRVRPHTGYAASLRENVLESARVGVFRDGISRTAGEGSDVVADVIERSLRNLEAAGAVVSDAPPIVDFQDLLQAATLYTQQCKHDLNQFFESIPSGPVASFDDLWSSKRYHPLLDFFDVIASGPTDPSSDPAYYRGFWAREHLQRNVLRAMAECNVDVLVYPTVQVPPPFKADVDRGRWSTMAFPANTALAPHATMPALTLPVGFTPDGMPVGLEMLGRPYDEARLLNLAYAYERAFAPRRSPTLDLAQP